MIVLKNHMSDQLKEKKLKEGILKYIGGYTYIYIYKRMFICIGVCILDFCV